MQSFGDAAMWIIGTYAAVIAGIAIYCDARRFLAAWRDSKRERQWLDRD